MIRGFFDMRIGECADFLIYGWVAVDTIHELYLRLPTLQPEVLLKV